MSVLIKGMEMPNVCAECWALDVYDDCIACLITQDRRSYNFQTKEKRMKNCPLVPVPTPHGRLIIEDGEIIAED